MIFSFLRDVYITLHVSSTHHILLLFIVIVGLIEQRDVSAGNRNDEVVHSSTNHLRRCYTPGSAADDITRPRDFLRGSRNTASPSTIRYNIVVIMITGFVVCK